MEVGVPDRRRGSSCAVRPRSTARHEDREERDPRGQPPRRRRSTAVETSSRWSMGHPPEMRTTVLSPGTRPSSLSATRSAARLVSEFICVMRHAMSACIWTSRMHAVIANPPRPPAARELPDRPPPAGAAGVVPRPPGSASRRRAPALRRGRSRRRRRPGTRRRRRASAHALADVAQGERVAIGDVARVGQAAVLPAGHRPARPDDELKRRSHAIVRPRERDARPGRHEHDRRTVGEREPREERARGVPRHAARRSGRACSHRR